MLIKIKRLEDQINSGDMMCKKMLSFMCKKIPFYGIFLHIPVKCIKRQPFKNPQRIFGNTISQIPKFLNPPILQSSFFHIIVSQILTKSLNLLSGFRSKLIYILKLFFVDISAIRRPVNLRLYFPTRSLGIPKKSYKLPRRTIIKALLPC